MKQVIDEAPESPAAKKLQNLMQTQLQAYDKLMDKHELSKENQKKLLKMVADYSDH
jgi:hypothetical protein